jgi:hypothetical protein
VRLLARALEALLQIVRDLLSAAFTFEELPLAIETGIHFVDRWWTPGGSPGDPAAAQEQITRPRV